MQDTRIRMNRLTYISTIVLSLLQLSINAQDYKADLDKALNIYKQKKMEIQMEYQFFPSYTSIVPQEKEKMILKKEENRFYCNQFGLQTICDDQYVLLIDDESQMLAIDRRMKQSKEKLDAHTKSELEDAVKKLTTTFGLDSLTKDKTENFNAEYLGVKNGKKEYVFNYKRGEYEKSVFSIDVKTGILNKLKMYYREPMQVAEGKWEKVRVEINYLKQVANPVFAAETFNIKKYVEMQADGKVTPKDKYKDYTVINHLIKYDETTQSK